ncbi:30S ribosomal protein S6 [Candidatus Amesbacteria bacterium]|nr:30S ribosomal protein S6 [Candidatus Amesbacteria bacterium]
MKKYDLTVLVKSDLKEKALDKFVGKMEDLVKALDGKTGKITEMGKKQLAYTIKKQKEAQFLTWVLEVPPKNVVQLEKKLVNDKDILRHLLVCLRDR